MSYDIKVKAEKIDAKEKLKDEQKLKDILSMHENKMKKQINVAYK